MALECCVEGALAGLAEGASPTGSQETGTRGYARAQAILPLVKAAADHVQTFASTPLPHPLSTRRFVSF